MAKYLLPCECGEGVAIEPSQAGSSVVCQCGKSLEVPTLRGIRTLDPIQATAARQPTREWSPLRGGIFVVAFVGMLAGAGIAGYAYKAIQKVINVSADQEQQLYAHYIDQTPVDELYAEWRIMREQRLGSPDENAFVNARKQRRVLTGIITFGIGLSVAGIVGMIISLVLPGKPAGQP